MVTVVLVLTNLCWLHHAYCNIVVTVVPRVVAVTCCRKVIVVVAITVKVGKVMCKFVLFGMVIVVVSAIRW